MKFRKRQAPSKVAVLSAWILVTLLLSLVVAFCQVKPQPHRKVRCASYQHHVALLATSPNYRRYHERLDQELADYLRRRKGLDPGLRSGILTIPVVVHVIYANRTENISDDQIMSQIDVLNEDFRRLNSDASGTPSAFGPLAADTRIEFKLAVRAPASFTVPARKYDS